MSNVIPLAGWTRRTPTAVTPTPASMPGHEDPEPGEHTAPVLTITRAVYTVAEVAEILSLSTGSTYALIRTGDIPARKLGGRWVIPQRRFHAWLDDLPEATDEDVARACGIRR